MQEHCLGTRKGRITSKTVSKFTNKCVDRNYMILRFWWDTSSSFSHLQKQDIVNCKHMRGVCEAINHRCPSNERKKKGEEDSAGRGPMTLMHFSPLSLFLLKGESFHDREWHNVIMSQNVELQFTTRIGSTLSRKYIFEHFRIAIQCPHSVQSDRPLSTFSSPGLRPLHHNELRVG